MGELFSTTLWNAVRKNQESVPIINGLFYNNNNLIVCESDEFRTRFILQMMFDFANQDCNSFLDQFVIRKRDGRHSALYINTENSIKDIKSILRDVSYSMDNNLVIGLLNEIHFIDCYGVIDYRSNITNFKNLFQGVIENENISLIVIDSYSGINKRRKSEVPVREAMNDLSEITFIAQQYGIPIILTNKIKANNADLEDALSSSIAFTNWSNNIIWLKKTGNDSCLLKKIKSGNEFLTDNSEIGIKFDGKRFHATGY